MDYIRWLKSNYMDVLRGPPAKSGLDFTYEQVESVYRTDHEIVNLYCGYESGSSWSWLPLYDPITNGCGTLSNSAEEI